MISFQVLQICLSTMNGKPRKQLKWGSLSLSRLDHLVCLKTHTESEAKGVDGESRILNDKVR